MTKWTQQMPLLMEVEGISLLTDKDVEQIKKADYKYYYTADTVLEDADHTVRKAGNTVEKTDLIPEGTLLEVAVPVSCSDKSPYVDDTPNHELSGTFRILDKK